MEVDEDGSGEAASAVDEFSQTMDITGQALKSIMECMVERFSEEIHAGMKSKLGNMHRSNRLLKKKVYKVRSLFKQMAALNEELISEDEEELSGEDAHPNKGTDKQM
jgi:hypothetical protein